MPAPADHLPLLQHLAALGDLARLRILRLLDKEELSVGELAKALQLPQSTVSRHLKLLHEGGWIAKRSAGTASLYRVHPELTAAVEPSPSEPERAGGATLRVARMTRSVVPPVGALARTGHAAMRDLWAVARAQLGEHPTLEQDDARLAEVLAERRIDSKAFFGQIGGEWDSVRRELFGESFTTEALLGLIHEDWVVADIGCGTGNAAEQLAPHVKKVIAIDREPAMLEAAKKRLAGFPNVEFRRGELSISGGLPLRDREIDAALVFLVLVHVESPAEALKEIARTLKPGGFVLTVDLVRHDREGYLHTMGHRHLGFDEKQVKSWAKHAGLGEVRYRRLRPSVSSKGPGLFVATMRTL